MSTIASLDVDLALNSAKFVEGLRKARQEHEDFAKSLSELGERAGGIGESMGVGIGSGFAMHDMVEKAMEAQESQAKLAAVLRATGEAAGFSAAGMEHLAEETSRLTVYSRDAVRSAETVLATFTHIRGDQFEGALKAATDLATVFNMDLSTAAEKVGRALENPAEGLQSLARMGVQFSAGQKAVIQSLVDTGQVAKAQAEILSAINEKVAGSAVASADTAKGAIQQLKNEYDELAADVGKTVLPVVTTVANSVKIVAETAGAASTGIKIFQAAWEALDAFLEAKGPIMAALEAATEPEAAGLMIAAAVGVYATVKGLEALDAAQNKAAEETEAAARAHRQAADAARQHADALMALAASAEKAAAERKILLEQMDRRVREHDEPLSTQIQQQIVNWQDDLKSLQQSMPAGSPAIKDLQDTIGKAQKDLQIEQGKESAGDWKHRADEMRSQADAIRESIMSPVEKFRQTLRDLQTLVQNNALDPQSAMLAGRAALANLASSVAEPEHPAALLKGTAAAYSAALRNDSGNNPMLETAQKQLDQMLKDATNFDAMTALLQTIAGNSDPTETVSM